MTGRPRPADQARTALSHATLIASTIDAALGALAVGLGGFPASTPGASPSELSRECHVPGCDHRATPCLLHGDTDDVGESANRHEPTETSTIVERNAIRGDKARADQAALLKSLDEASRHLARAAGIAYRWGLAGIDVSEIKARMVSLDEGIWCQHCSQFGRHEPRMSGGYLHCRWCVAFHQRYKHLPPKEIWDARDARGGQLDVVTIKRVLAKLRTKRKTAAKLAKLESAS